MPRNRLRLAPMLLAASALCACEVGPNYHRPTAPTPTVYKRVEGWTPAHPSDAADRADWWTVFGDPTLNDLESKVAISNQNLVAAEAAYRQARALVAEQRAALWPTISGTGAASASHSGAGAGLQTGTGTVTGPSTGRGVIQNYQLELGGTWEPDVWGRIRREIENAKANAQASAADLANARLSAQMELAADYITLRQLDEEKRIDDDTVKAYAESLEVTRNKFKAGVAAQSDVDQAETQLYNERAADTALESQRAMQEDAIAILTGVPPASLDLPSAPWTLTPVDIPPGVPSTLLERRPDVAAAERQAAAASANIGVAVAGYYPDITLTGSGGTDATKLAQLFTPQSFFWSLGGQAVETIFNGGLTRAQVQAAKASYDEAVANYREAVLTAFDQVEDNLSAQRVLAAEQPDLQAAVKSADDALRVNLNEYRAGTVDYTTVVVAQAAALSAHNAELQLEASRLTTTVDLIVALGGGWNQSELKDK
ncbi:MAG TPA: efflux transporter outer membrane subunit [Caulobacteraceae bacterium]|nr:efflux transporter outer membrane subunit [Caulobacteraceae bacterium]